MLSPFKPHERLYKTGDLGRWYPLGEIQFRGRIDHQIKIRGFRVELDEIQNRLLEIDGVRSAAVIVFEEGERKLLCGYMVGKSVPSAPEVRAILAESLPYYMVPTYLMELEELPLTASEKLDRSRLPIPQAGPTASRPLETATQHELAILWQELLGVTVAGRDDHFFEMGGDSLSIVRMVGKVAEHFDVDIELEEVYREPTLLSCANLIDQAEAGHRRPIKPLSGKKYYPATPTQQRMLFAAKQDPDSVSYNVPALFVFEGSLEEDRLKSALGKLVRRHTILRTSLVLRDEMVMQHINKEVDLPYFSVKCSDKNLMETAKSCLAPFNPASGSLMRLTSVVTSKQHALIFDFHHAICDQVSLGLVIEDFAALYQGEELPPLVIDYKDCAVWLHERLAADALISHQSFWKKEMVGDIPLLNLPLQGKRDGRREGGECGFRVKGKKLESLRQHLAKEKVTLFSTLLGIFGLVLSRQSLQNELVIGTPVSGRTQAAMQQVIGAFINTLPLRCRIDDTQSVGQYFDGINKMVMRALSHQDYPYERIVSDLEVKRERGRNPLFDVMLVVGKRDRGLSLAGTYADALFLPTGTSKLDMTLYVYEDGSDLECRLEYDKKLFTYEYARLTLERFVHVLSTVFDHLDKRMPEFCVLPPEEYRAVTETFSATEQSFDEKPLHEWIEGLAFERPEEDAIVAGGKTLSFAELNRRANRIAHTLIAAGARAEKPVAIMMNRSVDLIPALFGIMKAGAAYIPIDPHYPIDRITFMLQDSKASLLLCDKQSAIQLQKKEDSSRESSFEFSVVMVEEALGSTREDNPQVAVKGSDPAYIIYTSGSTGQPKGSLLTRRGVANLMMAMSENIAYDPSQTGVSVTTISFDIFVTDSIVPLCYGCRTVLADEEELRQPYLLARLLERENVEYLQTTPSRLQVMLRDKSFAAAAGALRKVVLAGEKPSLALLQTAKSMMPEAKIKNGYGPTEVTVYTSFQDMTDSNYVSIGYPIANTHVYILDEGGRPVPIGTPAEACISGVGVSPGYIGRDELNAQRFLPDPFRPGNILYRSGDICYFDESGEIFIVGRADHQVKIRGLRIETGEIEVCLQACEGVKDAIAMVWGDDENKQIVAYYTGEEQREASELRTALMQNLPTYMIPTRFCCLDAIPMTANGKVDRTRLPDPQTFDVNLSRPSSNTKKALTKEQKRFLRVVERVLDIEEVSLDDNVFELGGDSLSIISIQARMAKYGQQIRTQDFYDASTFGALLSKVDSSEEELLQDQPTGPDSLQKKTEGTIKQQSVLSKFPNPSEIALRKGQFERRNKTAAKRIALPGVKLSRVVVTGATGFLGAHVIDALSRQGVKDIFCLVRGGSDQGAQARIEEALATYFPQQEIRVQALNADIAADLSEITSIIGQATAVYHCAALTEHVGKREDYERVNVEGTRHVIELSRCLGADFLYVSTTSVAGLEGASFEEKNYDVGQNVSFNEYVRSKFIAEGLVLDAFESGLRGRIFRVGNLTGRYSDGFFQRKARRNAFAMRLAALTTLGYYPAEDDSLFELTPVDSCAHALVTLSTRPSDRYIYHLCSDRKVDIEGLATLLGSAGHTVKGLSAHDFAQVALSRSEHEFEALFGVVRDIVERTEDRSTPISTEATVESLARVGLSWPKVDTNYFSLYLNVVLKETEKKES